MLSHHEAMRMRIGDVQRVLEKNKVPMRPQGKKDYRAIRAARVAATFVAGDPRNTMQRSASNFRRASKACSSCRSTSTKRLTTMRESSSKKSSGRSTSVSSPRNGSAATRGLFGSNTRYSSTKNAGFPDVEIISSAESFKQQTIAWSPSSVGGEMVNGSSAEVDKEPASIDAILRVRACALRTTVEPSQEDAPKRKGSATGSDYEGGVGVE